ncbi:DUF262 domain-containing protein [Parasediminibacterium paludis]|uniref:DUF262 domain-containing protein n=1 Tax=Parasediminibacterium paludis TaxID=908966 RepID=A0ABV8PTU8_9BACT
MEDVFKPDNKTIRQIFGDSDAFYRMPVYQRPYSWDKERVEQLWYDVLDAYKNHKDDETLDPNYFLGSVVVVKKGNHYEVVDGQQRLTTLTILFCTLRDLNLDLVKKNSILNSIKDLVEDKERLKLTTHLNNQALFEETVLRGINFNATKTELFDNRFLQTALYFRELIQKAQDKNQEDYINNFSDFIDYLFDKTTIIRIVCFDEGFAIKLFTVLNDRGLDLTPADIIKAYLLQNLDEDRRNNFTEVWKRIENTCKLSGENLQGVFNFYLYYLKSDNPRKALQDELKEQFKDKNPQEIILDIEKFATYILEINANNKDKDISMLKYLRQSIYWKSILATAKQVDYPNYDVLKSLITKYYYQSWIANGTSNRIKQTSFNILKKVKQKSNIEEIKALITDNLNKYDNYLGFLSNENAYWTNWHKPLLLSIEYYQQDARDFIPISRDLHTEHILPKEWNKKDLNWSDTFSETTAKPLLNSLGNLTLLSGTKNIQASNSNYMAKIDVYTGNSGKGIDGKTSFEITKKVIEDYKVWNAESIQNRYLWLIKETQRILDI